MNDKKPMRERGGTINPFLDWSFKYLFGREETKDLVYAICLMDFTYEKNPVLRSDYLLRDARDGRVFSDRLNVITLQIPCMQARSFAECRESYEKLLYLLVAMKDGMKTFEEIVADIEAETSSPAVKAMLRRVAETADKASLSPSDRVAYDYALKRYRDYYSGLKTAQSEGYDKGREEGREEEKRTIARAMKENGISPETIAQCTGLSELEIAEL